jgi:type I restriction enzyme M protein
MKSLRRYQNATLKEVVSVISYVASFDEIQENDFNLNISRYVKKHEEQAFVDLESLRQQREELLSTLHELEEK